MWVRGLKYAWWSRCCNNCWSGITILITVDYYGRKQLKRFCLKCGIEDGLNTMSGEMKLLEGGNI